MYSTRRQEFLVYWCLQARAILLCSCWEMNTANPEFFGTLFRLFWETLVNCLKPLLELYSLDSDFISSGETREKQYIVFVASFYDTILCFHCGVFFKNSSCKKLIKSLLNFILKCSTRKRNKVLLRIPEAYLKRQFFFFFNFYLYCFLWSRMKFLFLLFLREIKTEEHKILSGQALLLHTMEQLEETKISS